MQIRSHLLYSSGWTFPWNTWYLHLSTTRLHAIRGILYRAWYISLETRAEKDRDKNDTFDPPVLPLTHARSPLALSLACAGVRRSAQRRRRCPPRPRGTPDWRRPALKNNHGSFGPLSVGGSCVLLYPEQGRLLGVVHVVLDVPHLVVKRDEGVLAGDAAELHPEARVSTISTTRSRITLEELRPISKLDFRVKFR